MTLGQKIRALRKEKGITQSELAGEEITRNMLSSIEGDKALPSLPTLLYLAERLEVSAGYLIDPEATAWEQKKRRFLPAVKAAYKNGNYKEALRLYKRDLAEQDDEVALLMADASMRYAMQLLHMGKLLSAERTAGEALSFCEATCFPTFHIEAGATLVRAITTNVQSPKYEVTASAFTALRDAAVFEDLYHYTSEQTEGYHFRDAYYAAHIAARELIAKGQRADAIKALEALEAKKTEKGFSVLVLFRVYADLELCHKELFNYEAAYRYSAKRISLLSAFRA